MAFIPFSKCVKLEAIFRADFQAVENVHTFEFLYDPSIEDMTDLAASYKAWWTAQMQADCNSITGLEKIICTDLSEDNAPAIEYTTGLPLYGTSEEEPLPNSVTMAVKWLTNYRGRSYRGRTYHVGFTTADVEGSIIPATQINAYKGSYELLMLIGASLDNTATMVVASRVSNGVEREFGLTTPITGVAINNVVDSQRRRLPERGR